MRLRRRGDRRHDRPAPPEELIRSVETLARVHSLRVVADALLEVVDRRERSQRK